MSDKRVFDDDFKYALGIRWRAQQMYCAADMFIQGWKKYDKLCTFESVARRLGLKDTAAAKKQMLFEPKNKKEAEDEWILPGLFEAMDREIRLSSQLIGWHEDWVWTVRGDGDGI